MKHARKDYTNRIQDSDGLIPIDEPVFLIRGQDINAPDAVRDYGMRAARSGASVDLVRRCFDWATEMERWQSENGVKTPDLPEGA